MNEIKEYRADGWPLCPRCEEDELWSALQWNGEGDRPPLSEYIAAGLSCYYCGWQSEENNIPIQLRSHFAINLCCIFVPYVV